jgi:hypothetical protein
MGFALTTNEIRRRGFCIRFNPKIQNIFPNQRTFHENMPAFALICQSNLQLTFGIQQDTTTDFLSNVGVFPQLCAKLSV